MRYILTFWTMAILVRAQATGTPDSELARIDREGESAMDAKRFEEAEVVFRQGLAKARDAGEKSRVAEFTRQIGATYELRKDFRTARTYYEASLTLREQLGQKKEAARLYAGIGYVSALLRDDSIAERRLNQAIRAYEELQDESSSALPLQILGQLHARRGVADAGALLERALAIYEVEKNTRNIALTHGMLADLYWRYSEYRNAFDHGFKSLETNQRINSESGSAQAYELLGNIYLAIGQPEKGLIYFQQTLALRERLGLTEQLAFSYNNIGAVLSSLHRNPEALESYEKALALRRASGAIPEIASTLVNVGVVQLELRNAAAAERSFVEAYSIADKNGFLPQTALATFHLGELDLSRNHLDEAASRFQRAYLLQQQLNDPRSAGRSLDRLASIAEQRGDLAHAVELYDLWLKLSENLVLQISDPAQISAFRQESALLYPRYARVLLKLGRTADALMTVERGRGSGLARLAVLAQSNFQDLLTPVEAKEWRGATVAFARSANALREALGPDGTGDADRARASYSETQHALDRLRDRLFVSSPGLQSVRPQPPAGFSEIAGLAARRRDTLFLEWAVVDDENTLLFAVGPTSLDGYVLNIGQSRLRELAGLWRRSMAGLVGRGVSVASSVNPLPERLYAGQLFTWLFAPVSELLLRNRWDHLVIVPDGPTLALPFAALLTKAGDRLIDRIPVAAAVSLTNLARVRPPRKSAGSMYVVGDPLLPGERRIVPPSGDAYTRLEHALEEAKSVSAMDEKSVLVTGANATEAAVKKALSNFDILHFATHGILDNDNGLGSGLLLATEPANSDEDGILYAWEIAGVSLSARLAVLSACDTGRGVETSGEGIIGLAWAFQGAGCPNVVASLWNVDDAATSELMKSFYAKVREGSTLDSALRAAMLNLRDRPQYAAPGYWAAFRVIGPADALTSVAAEHSKPRTKK